MATTVLSNYSPCGERRLFPLQFSESGKACVLGDSKKHMESTDLSFIVAYQSDGKRAITHSSSERDKCLYEIGVGDYIGIFETDTMNDILYINLYQVSRLTNNLAICQHVIM